MTHRIQPGWRGRLLVAPTAICALAACVAPANAATKPSIKVENDANQDGVFSVAEVLPKKMPSSIAYRLTVDAGNANGPFGAFHKIIAISDDKTANIGSCQALVGTNMLLNQVYTCSYAIALSPAPIVPLVNTVRLTYDNGGNDLLASSSVVQGGGKCNSGNGNGSDPIQFTDPTAHCYGGDPGNSYNAGNKGGDEIPTSGGVPNPGGNNTP